MTARRLHHKECWTDERRAKLQKGTAVEEGNEETGIHRKKPNSQTNHTQNLKSLFHN